MTRALSPRLIFLLPMLITALGAILRFQALFLDKDVSGASYVRILLAQAVLSALTVLLAYWLFSAVAGPLPALAVGLLTALSPHLINMYVYLQTETLFGFWLGPGSGGIWRHLAFQSIRPSPRPASTMAPSQT